MGNQEALGKAFWKDRDMVTLLMCSPLVAVFVMALIVAKDSDNV